VWSKLVEAVETARVTQVCLRTWLKPGVNQSEGISMCLVFARHRSKQRCIALLLMNTNEAGCSYKLRLQQARETPFGVPPLGGSVCSSAFRRFSLEFRLQADNSDFLIRYLNAQLQNYISGSSQFLP